MTHRFVLSTGHVLLQKILVFCGSRHIRQLEGLMSEHKWLRGTFKAALDDRAAKGD